MSTITVLSNQHFDLFFHEDKKIVHHVFKPAMGSAQLAEVLSAGTDLLEKYGATKWLSDNRDLAVAFSDEAAQWTNEVWLPRTVNAGWKFWAMVVPEALIGREDHVKYVESFYEKGVWVTVHTEVEPAMKWLEAR